MRGDVWSIAGSGYASKPRPAVIVQSNESDVFDSSIVCLLTSQNYPDARTRVRILPNEENGLDRECFVMADKVLAVKKSSFGGLIGHLSVADMEQVDLALKFALGL